MFKDTPDQVARPTGTAKGQLSYFLVLGAVLMFSLFAVEMNLLALPAIAGSIGKGIDVLEISVSMFLVAIAMGQLVLEPISEPRGQRRILIGGLFAFVAGSPFGYIIYFDVAPEHDGLLMGMSAIVTAMTMTAVMAVCGLIVTGFGFASFRAPETSKDPEIMHLSIGSE